MRYSVGLVALDRNGVITISQKSGHHTVVKLIQLSGVLVHWTQVGLVAGAMMRSLAWAITFET